jgi:hypothetical protein
MRLEVLGKHHTADTALGAWHHDDLTWAWDCYQKLELTKMGTFLYFLFFYMDKFVSHLYL